MDDLAMALAIGLPIVLVSAAGIFLALTEPPRGGACAADEEALPPQPTPKG